MAKSSAALLCIVLVLSTAIPRISGQTPSPPAPTPPSGAGAGGSSATPPSGSSASGSSASPPPGSSASPPPGSSATPPARASVPPTTAPPTASPPTASPPTSRVPSAAPPTASPPTASAPTSRAQAPAPSTVQPILTVPSTGPSAGTPTAARGQAPAPGTAAPANSPRAATTISSPAPGPAGSGTVNVTGTVVTTGALSPDQQQQFCSVIVNAVKAVAGTVSQCAVTSQTVSTPPSFGATGRRLQQQSGSFTLTLGLSLSAANADQIPAIQNAINGLSISFGSSTIIQITVISITINIQVPFVIIVAPVPTGVNTLPSTTVITINTNNTRGTVTTVVPTNATGNTTLNVPASMAKPPAPAMGGTMTVTTLTNTTHTTTITTNAVYSITLQFTIITQYFYTVLTGQTTGVFVIIVFNLPGNVVTNVPKSVTGGATTGQTTTITVVGVTFATIQTTSQITSTTTTTTTTTTGTTTGTTTNTTGGTTGVVTGTTKQVCMVPNNPYGVIQNMASEGTLVKGGFLVSCWNDAAKNNPGQGNLIYQCLPNGTTTVWSNVTISGACKSDNAGVGLTMALSRCGSVIIVGSLPVSLSTGRPSPGCLIALDLTGKVINEVKSPEINGPWGSVCTSSGGNINYALSSVLGGLSSTTSNSSSASLAPSSQNSLSPASGRKLLQAPASAPSGSAPTGGFVVVYKFPTPTANSAWSTGPPTFILSGIQTNGTAVATGAVSPGGLTVDDKGMVFAPDLNGNRVWGIPNGLTTATSGQASQLSISGNVLNAPNSVSFGNNGQLVGTNTGSGTLFYVTLNSARNGGNATTQQVDPQNSPGVLFQAIFSTDATAGAPVGSVWFQHDGTNTLNTVTTTNSTTG